MSQCFPKAVWVGTIVIDQRGKKVNAAQQNVKNAAQQNIEDAYNLIRSHTSGMPLCEIWRQVKSHRAPYSLAHLILDGRIKSVQRAEKLYYVARENESSLR